MEEAAFYLMKKIEVPDPYYGDMSDLKRYIKC